MNIPSSRRGFLKDCTAIGTGAWLVTPGFLFATSESDPPIAVDFEPQLFLDDAVVARADGLSRTLHPPVKKGLIQEADGRPWDRGDVYHGNIVCRDAAGRFHMTYRYMWWDAAVQKFKEIGADRAHWFRESIGYATSDDGIRWRKPRLGLVEAPTEFAPQEAFPFEAPRKASLDNNLGCPIDFVHDLHAHGGREEPGQRFLMRVVRREDTHPFAKAVEAGMYFAPDFPDLVGDPHWRDKLTPIPGATLSPRGFKTLAGYDPSTKEWFALVQDTIAHWQPRGGRDIARYASADLSQWRGPDLVLPVAEDETRRQDDWVEYMEMNVFRLGGPKTGAWLGEVIVFHSDRGNPQFEAPTIRGVWRKGITEIRLMISRDAGKTWQRVRGKDVWLPHHERDDGFDRLVFGTYPVEVGDEWWFYYGCWDGDHLVFNRDGDTYYPHRLRRPRTALAVTRRHGLVSMRAEAAAELLTHPLATAGNRLLVNAAAGSGKIRIELRDVENRPIQGYAFADSQPLKTDGVAQMAHWNGKAQLPSVAAEKPFRLLFQLRNADLYAFQFAKQS